MFTKYTNMRLPQNYSGSRFKATAEDTEMKTHRAKEAAIPINTVKTSISPFFQSSYLNEQASEPEAEDETFAEYEEIPDTTEVTKETLHEAVSEPGKPTLGDLSRLLEGLKSDDLLLLALIILLASDGGQGSMDTIAILALLLLC